MPHSPLRRVVLFAGASLPFAGALASSARAAADAGEKLAALELVAGGRLGVAGLNTADGARVSHRQDERFPFCSTFKLLAASAVLKRSASEPGLLARRLTYSRAELVANSPVTGKHVDEGMAIADLCAAALQYSDNTAANLLIELLGGPAAVTAFARAIGDEDFRLDRRETALNTAIPGDVRDTSTPAAMASTLQKLTVGDQLGVPERDTLVAWMRGNTTGAKRIRASSPAGWSVADKTGTGDYGTTNDIGVAWPPARPPIVLAVFFTQADKDATARDNVISSAARIAIDAFGVA